MNTRQKKESELKTLLTGTRKETVEAVEYLYRVEKPKFFKQLCKLCTETAFDTIFSDALMVLMDKAAFIEQSPTGYLYRICYFRCIDIYRLNKKEEAVLLAKEELERLPMEENFSILASQSASLERSVQLLMKKLGAVDAEILRKRYFENQSPQEIAVDLDIRPQSAANKLHRSIKRLRKILEEEPKLKAIIEAEIYETI
ncbi:MAG: sigma-70 family RNA polymerase sigma factor [Bacteroidota bacterium]